MSFMRLGTRIAVINDANEILLSKRGDFGVWALPGGRVDSGEILHKSAMREVREETGLNVEIERPIGLYFQQGRSRMNVLYRAKPLGGELYTTTDETLDNRFFAYEDIPEDLFGKFYIDHAYSNQSHLYTVETPFWELVEIDLKLRWRWIQNLLAGRPEPKFNPFIIRAFAVIWHENKVFIQGGNLPYVISDGKLSLPDALSQKFNQSINWQWVGLWQDTSADTLDFVFHAHHEMKIGSWLHPHELDNHFQQYTRKSEEIWYIS